MNISKWKKLYLVMFFFLTFYIELSVLILVDKYFNFPEYLTAIYIVPAMVFIYYFLLGDHVEFIWKYRNDQRKNNEIKKELRLKNVKA